MKKIIAIVLAALLVAGGLGSLAYAQTDPVNEVSVSFHNNWIYDVDGDTFSNSDSPVTGRKSWHSGAENPWDETGAPVTALALNLNSTLEFDEFRQENLVSEDPPPYEWFFGDIPQEGWRADASVGFMSPDVFPVTFTPGFDASRSVDKTEFLQSEVTQTQILTITLTPGETTGGLSIGIGANENNLVNPVITPPTSGDDFHLSPDGHRIDIWPVGLELGEEWSITVEIEVAPKVPKVEFMPFVDVKYYEELDSDTTSGGFISYSAGDPADGVGTWTWSAEPWNAEGSYQWEWTEAVIKGVAWQPYSREIPVPHQPMTGQKLVGEGFYGKLDFAGTTVYHHPMFTFTNPDCVSEITIERVSIFDRYGTALYEGPLKPYPAERIMKPHQVGRH